MAVEISDASDSDIEASSGANTTPTGDAPLNNTQGLLKRNKAQLVLKMIMPPKKRQRVETHFVLHRFLLHYQRPALLLAHLLL
ncbi:hypothetical protein GH714_010176 [Hevea brasiliensis]|uniref:Uncharacterized protein n=1 Tax=Hevea brasiliensis TaxID=3981 RepID=A0A6A6KS97_HEVBR|nr:hypothetical protein GH714_010176 [Hevea brasiliensis]